MISAILIPTDGSKTAQKAGMYAIDLAKQLHASVIILNVIDKRLMVSRTVAVDLSRSGVVESLDDYLREGAERYVAEIKKLCEKKGVKSKAVIKIGHPAEEIIKEAKKSKADLIIMGSHGQSALEAAVLGSISYGVIHKDTTIPILVVKK